MWNIFLWTIRHSTETSFSFDDNARNTILDYSIALGKIKVCDYIHYLYVFFPDEIILHNGILILILSMLSHPTRRKMIAYWCTGSWATTPSPASKSCSSGTSSNMSTSTTSRPVRITCVMCSAVTTLPLSRKVVFLPCLLESSLCVIFLVWAVRQTHYQPTRLLRKIVTKPCDRVDGPHCR